MTKAFATQLAAGALFSIDDPLVGGLIMLPVVVVFYLAVAKRYQQRTSPGRSRTEEVTLILGKVFVGLLLLLALFGIAKGLFT